MKEISVKRLYREVRYCPTRPKRWLISNKAKIPYRVGKFIYPMHALEKLLLALKVTKVQAVAYNQDSKGILAITSSDYKFKYKLKPLRGSR